MANKVEFQLSADVAQAVAAIDRLVAKQEQLFNKFEEGKDKGKTSFDAVEGAVGKVAAALGVAGGLGQAFQMVLQQIEERAAGISREAEKALSISSQSGQGAGRLLQNIPGMSDAELVDAQQGVNRVLLANPSQGAGAQLGLFDALTGVRSAVPTLTQEQALSVVNEAAQTRQLDSRLNLADVAQGFGSLMAATGLDANAVQNAAMISQSQGFVADLGGVLKGTSRIQPAAKIGGISPTDSFAMFNFATKTLNDTGGEQSTTAVATMLSNLMTKAGEVEELTGFRPQGNALERLRGLTEFVQGGGVDEDTMGKLMPKLAEGVAGRTLVQRLFSEGFGVLQAERDVFSAADLTGQDLTANQIGRARNFVPGFDAQFKLRSQEALREAALSLDENAQERAAVRAAMMADLAAQGAPDRLIKQASEEFDIAIYGGYTPARALEMAVSSTKGAFAFSEKAVALNRIFGAGGASLDKALGGTDDALDAANKGSPDEFLDKFVDKMEGAVRQGMTRALQDTKQRSTVSEESR
jgi:hypothetical protein